MEFADFAINVVGQKALDALDATPPDVQRAGHHAGLLADMLAAAAGEVATEEWLCVWSMGAMKIYCHRLTEAYCRDRLGRAALAFIGAQDITAAESKQAVRDLLSILEADPNYTPFTTKAVLALQIDLLCKANVAAFPEEYPPALLLQVFDVEDEDWVSEQLSKLHEARQALPLPSGDNAEVAKIWKSLSQRGGGAQGAGASAMRLSSIYGAHNISEAFIEDGLRHRTRATRRLTVELLRQQQENAAWWSAWHSAFVVLSDEQPWHIVQPVWEDVKDISGLFRAGVPNRWAAVLIQRAASHSDHRVVRHTTADTIAHSTDLDASIVLGVIPAALSVRGTLEGLATGLAVEALSIVLNDCPAPTVSTAAAVDNILSSVLRDTQLPAAVKQECLACVGKIVIAWRRSGGDDTVLAPLVARMLAGVTDPAAPFIDVSRHLACMSPTALAGVFVSSGVSRAARDAYVTRALAAGDHATLSEAFLYGYYSELAPDAFARAVARDTAVDNDLKFRSKAFTAMVSAVEMRVEGGGVSSIGYTGEGDATLSIGGVEFPVAPIQDLLLAQCEAGATVQDPMVFDALVTFLSLAEACPSLVHAVAAKAVEALTTAGADDDIHKVLAMAIAVPHALWGTHASESMRGALLRWCRNKEVPVAVNAMERLRLAAVAVNAVVPALPEEEQHKELVAFVEFMESTVLPYFGGEVKEDKTPAAPPADGARVKKMRKKKKAAPDVVMRGARELMDTVEACAAQLARIGGDAATQVLDGLLKTAWRVMRKYPVKFSGSRTMFAAFFRAAVKKPDVLGTFEGLFETLVPTSSLVASQLTRAAWGTVDDADLLAQLALFSPAPKACPLDAQHPAVLLAAATNAAGCGSTQRRVGASELASAVLPYVLRDDTPEGHDGSAAQLQRVRQWWLLCALLPQVDAATAELVASAAVAELKQSRVVPKTRVLVQNAWAVACALHPDTRTTLPHLLQVLQAPSTETRFAVSAIIVAAHLLLADPAVSGSAEAHTHVLSAEWRKRLLDAIVGWSLAMPHAARIHSQLVMAEYLDVLEAQGQAADAATPGAAPASAAFETSLLTAVKTFLNDNPHLRALRSAAGLKKIVSIYLAPPLPVGKGAQGDNAAAGKAPASMAVALPPFHPTSVEMKVLKALRLVQGRFSELDGDGESGDRASAPAAGWASKGSRKCPARARGGYAAGGEDNSDDENDDDDASNDAADMELVDPTHQRRPTPGRPFKASRPKICIVGSFLDNLPNQAGLCRTTEALFGAYAEVTLASLKCTTEPAFLRMSMASERWLRLLEVPPGERLAAYLTQKRLEGYRIVALEQTDSSTPAQDYRFHENTVLIIGNEQLGCPAWLLRRPELVHDFVELPLDGASRSLNAHVTASAMVWQFRLQTY